MDVTPSAGFTVRIAVEADRRALQAVDVLSFPPDERYENEFYPGIFVGTRFRALVSITPTGTIVAYALLDFIATITRLRSMAVHPSFRRCGVGKSLLQHVVASVSNDVDLFVNSENFAAQKLYARLGFTVDRTAPRSPGQLVMRLSR